MLAQMNTGKWERVRPSTSLRMAPERQATMPDHRSGIVNIFVFAFAVTALPIYLHTFSQPLALAVCVIVALGAVLMLEQHAPIIILTTNIFQNIFISMASSNYTDISQTDALKSYSFVTTIIFWLALMFNFIKYRRVYSPFLQRMLYVSSMLIAVYSLYCLAGMTINARNAIVYYRNIALPIITYQLFIIIGARNALQVPRIVATLLAALSISGYCELLFPDFWYALTNAKQYFGLVYGDRITNAHELSVAAQSGLVITDIMDYAKTEFFNTPLFASFDIKVQRLHGPILHPISFGYLLAVLMAFAAVHRRMALVMLALPLLLMTSAKGPLALAVFCVFFYLVARRRSDDLALYGLQLVLGAYAVFVFRSGLSGGDYHVLGLLGGINGFLQNPLGHTLGSGGNLSVADFASIDWNKYQHEGAADLAVESAVGVMLYQLGVASVAAFAFYAWQVWTAWRLYVATRAAALAFAVAAIATTLVNGLFQEEAYFSPMALSLVMVFVGLTLGAADRALAALIVANEANDERRRGLTSMRPTMAL